MLQSAVVDNFKIRARRASGFSLIEILVALIIFAGGIMLMSRVFVAGRYFIKEAENKSIAMKIASLQMEKYLAYSYSGLDALIPASDTKIDGPNPDATNPKFSYQATLKRQNEVHSSSSDSKTIPYIDIEVICSYKEKNINGVETDKYVRLKNIVTYPYFHIITDRHDYISSGSPLPSAPQAPEPAYTPMETIAEVTVKNKAESRLQIFYTLQIKGDPSAGDIDPLDTTNTQCYVDNVPQDIMTVSPITTQPVISNVIGITTPVLSVTPAGHKVQVRWSKTSAGAVKLKYVDLIVIIMES